MSPASARDKSVISVWIPPEIVWTLEAMNLQSIIGIVMIVAGAALLAYGGFTTTKRENVIDLGPLKVQAEVKERHSVPPLLSWALLGGGLVVLVLGLKKK
jgi:hypothetical protein